jgi:hypothetical protein
VTTSDRRDVSAAVCLVLLVCSALAWPLPQDDQQSKQAEKTPHSDKKKPQEKPYSLIFGTAYGPDDRPLYGVKITIRREGKKHGSWDLVSDHRGEFAQRVPAETSDYLIKGEAEYAPMGADGKPEMKKRKKLRGQTRVHIEGEERQDIGVHLTE